ncbi:MAG: hypothetical protein ACHP7C_10750 [Lysobacterales bacterium]
MDALVTLRQALALVVPELDGCCRDPWVVIGSAAARLAGVGVTIGDLDLLTSRRDADALIDCWQDCLQATEVQEGSDRFRSNFARFTFPGLLVEVMGGLEVFSDGAWKVVAIAETVEVDVDGLNVFIPSTAEQVRVLEIFGRPKDLQRAALLKQQGGAKL